MKYQTSLPLRFINGLIEGKVIFDAKYVSKEEESSLVNYLNSLFEEKNFTKAFQVLSSLPESQEIYLFVPDEYSDNLMPSGRYRFMVGTKNRWKNQLLVISESQMFKKQILEDSSSIIDIARIAQLHPIKKPSGAHLHPVEESTISSNAALLALSYIFNHEAVAYISCPLTPDKIMIKASGQDAIELFTDDQNNNLWWFLAQRRAMDMEFNKTVNFFIVDSRSAIVQEIGSNVFVEYPASSAKVPPMGSRLAGIESKLTDLSNRYLAKVVNGIAFNTPYTTEMAKMSYKIKRVRIQLEREREGYTTSTWSRIKDWFT